MLVIVRLRDGRELTIVKANAILDAQKVRADLERWRGQDVKIAFATHQGLVEVSSTDIVDVILRPRSAPPDGPPPPRRSLRPATGSTRTPAT